MQINETQGQVVPVTPIRKLLCRLPSLRRKRSLRTSSSRSVAEGDALTTPTWPPLGRSFSNLDAYTSTHIHCSNSLAQPKRAQLAIQQYDRVHDAIVVSTLPYYPFCCHQDLLAMTRPRLLQTAYLFNSCLSFNNRFTDLEVSSDANIRLRIEGLVGIVPGPIDEIKAISNSFEQCELDMAITPPSSPLAMYPSRRNGMLRSPPPRLLDVLVEEDERDFSSYRRTVKKRKVDSRKTEASQVSFDEL